MTDSPNNQQGASPGSEQEQTFPLTILTPEQEVFSGPVASAVIPTHSGTIELLPRHEALLALLRPGTVLLRQDARKADDRYAVSGGYLEVAEDGVVLLADAVGDETPAEPTGSAPPG